MATYAGRYDEALLKIVGRNVVAATSATVDVMESDGVTLATLYTDTSKGTVSDNPITPDATGNLEFFADPGVYVLNVYEGGALVRTDTVSVAPSADELDELDGRVAVVESAGSQSAVEVPFTPAGGIVASDVQAALVELDSEKAQLDAKVDVDGTVSAAIDNATSGLAQGFRFQVGSWVGMQGVVVDGNGVSAPLNLLIVTPLWLPSDTMVDRIGCHVVTAAPSGVVRLGIYGSGTDGSVGDLLLDAGTVTADVTGLRSVTIAGGLPAGLYWLAAVAQGSAVTLVSQRMTTSVPPPFFGQEGVLPNRTGRLLTGVSGSLPASNAFNGWSSNTARVALRIADPTTFTEGF